MLLGDHSNCHRTLGEGLRRLGVDVTVASNGSRWMDTVRQVNLHRMAGKPAGLAYFLDMYRRLSGPLSGYDIVAIHDLNIAELRPARMRVLFDLLRRRNRKIYLSAMSTDIALLDMLEAADSPLRYSEWLIDGRPAPLMVGGRAEWESWHSPELTAYHKYVLSRIDGAVSVLYEYHLAMERWLGPENVSYGGIPIDTKLLTPIGVPERPGKVKIFLGRDRNRKLTKGSDLLEVVAKRIVERHPDKAELTMVENVTFNEFVEQMRQHHLILDQIYSYTPATTALMAMASGLNAVTGAEEDYYRFIGETENKPIINAPTDAEGLERVIEDVVLHPEQMRERGLRSREFVEKHNACEVVARRFLDFWHR